jgi:hypothetical protein
MFVKLAIHLFINVLLFSLFLLSPAQAQVAPSRTTAPATAASSAQPQLAVTSGTFSPAVQQALEAGDARKAMKLCGAACKSSAAGSITTGEKTGTADYQCQNGNCACTSIPDCVAMSKICAPDTTGCNDYGCTCAEK